MKFQLLLAGLVLGAASTSAMAQAPAGQSLGGPAIPGICLLSREAVFANAAIGKAATARLQELASAAQTEIDTEGAPLEAEAKALQGQPDNAQMKTRREALSARWQVLQAKAAHNGREIEATRSKVLERIAGETQSVIAQAYAQKKCGLVLDRGTALGGNFTNDLTADVVRGLDAKIRTITFERERLPVQAQAATAR